jgi:hypothetical protein
MNDRELDYNQEADQDYVLKLKERSCERVYLETNDKRSLFANSCLEIQRVNPLIGGKLKIDELFRLRHLGTGKYLAVAEDNQKL